MLVKLRGPGWADNMLTGSVLPSELITYLPQSGTEALVSSKTLQAATVTKADVSSVKLPELNGLNRCQ